MSTATILMLAALVAALLIVFGALILVGVRGYRLYKEVVRAQGEVNTQVEIIMRKQTEVLERADKIQRNQAVLNERLEKLADSAGSLSYLLKELSQARSRLTTLD